MNTYKKIINETFTIEKALERIKWRFKNEYVKVNESKITINELDIKAVDFLMDWHKRAKEAILMDNLLFAKVYCYALKLELNHFKDIKIALMNLENELKLPIDYHYDNIFDILNLQWWEAYNESSGIEIKHPIMQSQEEKEIIKNKINNDEKYRKMIIGHFSKDKVYKSLNNTITSLINEIKK
jgi:hypothetical protein